MGSLIIFSVMIDAYALMTFSSVLDEAWNCANPRPYPKEKSIASVKIEKPQPIEPIKEVAKYSPLMIAGVIAVVVILLLKRRRA